MAELGYDYIIVGAGLAGASAIEGIRDKDEEGSILLIGSEGYLPYNRPPLSKGLLSGEKQVEDIFVYDETFYLDNNVDLLLNTQVISLDAADKSISDNRGNRWCYDKLLLTTGSHPRRLEIPGAELDGVFYYRGLTDYFGLRDRIGENKTAVVIGGGFIGSEMASELARDGVRTTLVFAESRIGETIYPQDLSLSIESRFLEHGVLIFKGDVPVMIQQVDGRMITNTRNGKRIESDMVIVGIGAIPATELAQTAGLDVEDGIVVSQNLQTANPFIYAAGDCARFPYLALGQDMLVDHWDNAREQGKHAGWSMAAGGFAYDYMPYFWSELFGLRYEAVGQIDSSLETVTDWDIQNDTGVVYYVKDNKVRGVMICNLEGKIDDARKLIRQNQEVIPWQLPGTIPTVPIQRGFRQAA